MHEIKAKNQVKGKSKIVAPRVFVLNVAGHDVSDAERFGTVVPLTEGRVNIFHVDRLVDDLRRKLEAARFDPRRDLFVISGSPVLGMALGLLLRDYAPRPINLLIWDTKAALYIKRTVTNIKIERR